MRSRTSGESLCAWNPTWTRLPSWCKREPKLICGESTHELFDSELEVDAFIGLATAPPPRPVPFSLSIGFARGGQSRFFFLRFF